MEQKKFAASELEVTEEDQARCMVKSQRREVKKYPLFCSTRITLALVLFLGYVLLYSMRVNLSVGMVCMVNHTALASMKAKDMTTVSGTIDACGNAVNQTVNELRDGPLVWSKKAQGLALSSFFWGYIVTQVPAGWLASRYGAKLLITIALGGGSILTLIMPIAAKNHLSMFIALRVLLGILHGMVFPATHVLWTRWAPPMEKSRLVGFSYAGAQIGNVIALPLSGILCSHGFDGGWPSVFYVFGIIGLVWTLLWIVFGASSPSEHRCISNKERDYIEMVLEGQVSEKPPKTPWLRIALSLPVWAITVANVTGDFGIYVFLTNLPTYMSENLGFDAEMSGLVSTLPYIGFWAMMNLTAFCADKIIEKSWLSVTVTRKFFNTLGLLTSAVSLLILTTFDCRHSIWLSVALLTIGVSFCGCFYGAGFLVNHVDIAPQFAGILMGISNGIGTCSGMVAPALIGVMTQQRTAQEWRNVFYLTAGVMTFGALFYAIFGSGERQEWAKEKKEASILELVDGDEPVLDSQRV